VAVHHQYFLVLQFTLQLVELLGGKFAGVHDGLGIGFGPKLRQFPGP